MSIRNPVYAPFAAGASIGPNLIVKIGSADSTVVHATAATDQPLGVTVQNITAAQGDRVDVVVGGIYEVKAGGNITHGDPVCSDTNGKAVKANPAATITNGVIGYALESAADGDLFSVMIRQGKITNGADS
jgi:Uncharacterized conserved protein (DUF2190)